MGLLAWLRRVSASASAAPPPFERTVCACKDCVSYCKTKPGALIPSDIGRIARRLVELGLTEREEDVTVFLSAARSTTVYDRDAGKEVQIQKIRPASDRRGRCVFLDESDRCRIHGVSPFGCAFFDAHMPREEADRRRLWSLHQIRFNAEYQAMREGLTTSGGARQKVRRAPVAQGHG